MLDQWMAVEQDQVYHKACPLCGQVIYQCRRYMAILCSTLRDVRRVKEQLFGTRQAFLEAQKKIHGVLTTPPGSELTHFADLKIYCAVVLPYNGVLVENVVYSKVSSNYRYQFAHFLIEHIFLASIKIPCPCFQFNVPEMQSMLDIANIWLEVAGRVALMELHVPNKYVRRLEMMYNTLFTSLMKRSLPLHALERADLQRELNRCHDLAQLYDRRSLSLPEPVQQLLQTPAAQAAWTHVLGIHNRRRPYIDELRERFREALQVTSLCMYCKYVDRKLYLPIAFLIRRWIRRCRVIWGFLIKNGWTSFKLLDYVRVAGSSARTDIFISSRSAAGPWKYPVVPSPGVI